MRAFNAFQIVTLFACLPFVIGWLNRGPFAYSAALVWLAAATYVFLFGLLCVTLHEFMK